MRGHDEIIAMRLTGMAPVALTFAIGAGKPARLGCVEVAPADDLNRLDLRFAFAVPCAVNAYCGDEAKALKLFDRLTNCQPTRVIFCGPDRLLEWTPDEGEIEWAA